MKIYEEYNDICLRYLQELTIIKQKIDSEIYNLARNMVIGENHYPNLKTELKNAIQLQEALSSKQADKMLNFCEVNHDNP